MRGGKKKTDRGFSIIRKHLKCSQNWASNTKQDQISLNSHKQRCLPASREYFKVIKPEWAPSCPAENNHALIYELCLFAVCQNRIAASSLIRLTCSGRPPRDWTNCASHHFLVWLDSDDWGRPPRRSAPAPSAATDASLPPAASCFMVSGWVPVCPGRSPPLNPPSLSVCPIFCFPYLLFTKQ